MSWSFDTVGKHADVCAEVANISSVPQEIKDIVAKFASENPPQGYHTGIRVKSCGHGYQVSELKTETFHIAPAAPVPIPLLSDAADVSGLIPNGGITEVPGIVNT